MITIWVPKRLVEIDLYNIAARSPEALAEMSERSYRERVRYAAEKVRFSGTKIVMLTGPSASGKTTSAHCLVKALQKRGTPAQVVSLDTIGELGRLYSLADVVFVGGSFVKVGGHNILEPAAHGKPVIVGPYMFNFQEIFELLESRGVCLMTKSEHEFKETLMDLLAHPETMKRMGEAALTVGP